MISYNLFAWQIHKRFIAPHSIFYSNTKYSLENNLLENTFDMSKKIYEVKHFTEQRAMTKVLFVVAFVTKVNGYTCINKLLGFTTKKYQSTCSSLLKKLQKAV